MSQSVLGSEAGPLYEKLAKGGIRLPSHIHPLPDLLMLTADQVSAIYRETQYDEFMAVFARLERHGGAVLEQLPGLAAALARDPRNPLLDSLSPPRLRELFMSLHEHVMGHPVWLHPFFRRMFEGRFTQAQLQAFARQYFNQIKNTRQCVALSLGRFNTLAPLPCGRLNESVSELTQIVLAGLLADEYGTRGSEEMHEGELNIRELFEFTTHIALYRQLFAGVGVAEADQDEPMLPGTADNVLTQRVLAGDSAFTPLESLASVGLGMEWGVPAFFSLLLGGIIRFAERDGLDIGPDHLEVLTAHVRQDVAHAISVMLVTAMQVQGDEDTASIRNATNMLMASRYQMMSEMHRSVFGEACPGIHQIRLAPRYHVTDRRIVGVLERERRTVPAGSVVSQDEWAAGGELPFVFAS